MGKVTVKTIQVQKKEQSFDRKELIKAIGPEKMKRMYTDMVRTRAFDDIVERMIRVEGFSILQHATTGQEATPIAATTAITKDDYVMPYHRGWGWGIGKGMDPKKMLAECLGKATGICRGKGGVQLGDWENKVMGRPGTQGAHLSIAAGVGLGAKLAGKGQVVVSFNGDGSSNTCNFYEGINLATIWDAPVIYIVENNGYSITQKRNEIMRIEDVAERSAAFGIPGIVVDGNDAVVCYKVISEAVERARSGKGPSLIETKTYRWLGHHAFDAWHEGGYRTKEEIESWKKKDPIAKITQDVLENGILTEKEMADIKAAAEEEMKAAREFAINSPLPTLEELLADLYAEGVK
jgi:TPP-dependent pyruvate/acetoin dehydrogenase alpha subunit